MIETGDSFAYTTDTRLASALSAVGIPFHEKQPYDHLEKDGKEWVQWNFEPLSKCGSYVTYDLIKAWKDDEKWLSENAEDHPFAIAMRALHIREFLVDGIKRNNPSVVIKNEQGTWVVPKNGIYHERLKQ